MGRADLEILTRLILPASSSAWISRKDFIIHNEQNWRERIILFNASGRREYVIDGVIDTE